MTKRPKTSERENNLLYSTCISSIITKQNTYVHWFIGIFLKDQGKWYVLSFCIKDLQKKQIQNRLRNSGLLFFNSYLFGKINQNYHMKKMLKAYKPLQTIKQNIIGITYLHNHYFELSYKIHEQKKTLDKHK